ncbi:MAG TPA: T9SS type A sorting domain-containing protein, partial [Ferruginibacter sp.]|nr:T9SS type A sorting domain-containing protein [Ferruginibacter sp.]
TTGEGYMTFIRGDRTVNTFPQAATSTVLRSKGALVTGTFGPVSVSAGLFKAIGNPYASAIDFSKLGRTGSVQDAFYVWDPSLGTLGGYVSFAGPFYSPSVVTASYPGANKLIESGSAFFVRAPTTAGTVTITEPCKDANSNLVQRLNDVQPFIRASLYHLPTAGGQVLFDGLWLRFDPAFANGVDNYDVLKMDNSGETVATQIGDQSFAIDSRHNISAEDTIQLKLGHVRAQNYQFEVNTGNNLEQFGVEAFVEDKYLNTKTPVSLSGTTLVPFTVVNEPGSYAADRFRIVFKRLAPVPVSFTQVRADKQQQNVLVSWKVDNEARIDHYEVEESADGLRFSRAANQVATGNNNSSVQYQWLDQQVNRGYNYYRIRSIGQSGESKISETVKVNFTETQPAMIAVYPNPVTEDRQLKVNMVNMATGVYKLNLYNVQGQLIYSSQLNHAGGNSVYTLSLDPMIAKGNYTLDLTTEKNEKSTFKVIVN